MSPGYFPRRRQQNKNNEALYSHKTKPTFLMPKLEEHNPEKPCKICFPLSNSMAEDFEKLGIRNLLLLMKNKEIIPRAATWFNIFLQNFKSIQIHAGQIEKIMQVKTRKVYVASHYNLWDEPILDYVLLSCLRENALFFNQPSNILMKLNGDTCVSSDDKYHASMTSAQDDKSTPVVIFINLDSQDESDLLNILCNQVNLNDNFEVFLVPVSISYEFFPVLPYERMSNQPKPHVRINFGHVNSLNKDLKERKDKPNAVSDLRKHMLHEIWKNTAIMSSHVFSMLHRYRPNFSTSQFSVWLDDFQKEFRSFYDLGFVGDINHVSTYTLEMLPLKGIAIPSMAIDLLKYDSIMMKSLTMVMNETAIDFRTETCRISQNQMLEKFRLLTKIFRYEIDYIYPPCIPPTRVEQNTLERLFQRSVASIHSSEMDSEEQAKAKRLARHLDIDFEEEGDWDYEPQSVELPLFVNIPNVISRKWVVGITNSLLEVYYVAARQLLELRKVDAMEDVIFFDRVCEAMNVLIDVKTSVAEFNSTLQNVLNLFEDEGILECYQHSGAKVIYMKDPLNEGPILQLIQDIAQFID